jgi:hypothetical protein
MSSGALFIAADGGAIMATRERVHVSPDGDFVISRALLERLGVEVGDDLTLDALSDRALVIVTDEASEFERATARVRSETEAKGITPEQVEQALDEAREEVWLEYQRERGIAKTQAVH